MITTYDSLRPMRLRIHPAVFLIACLVGSLGWLAMRANQESARYADKYVQMLAEREHFSGAVLVARDARTIFEAGYGFANAASRIPNTPQTRFSIASITKTFTATLILQFAEQGKLRLDDSVCKFVAACPLAWEAITLHHLLSHTSGLFNFTNDPKFHVRKRLQTSAESIMANVRGRPLRFDPGAQFDYSNTNYLLLAVVIESVARESYASVLRKQILEPLGMSDTNLNDVASLRENHASGYRFDDNNYVPADFADPSWGMGSGSHYSTVRDLKKWSAAFDASTLLSPTTIRQMTTPVLGDYGYGWSTATREGQQVVMHSGRIDGFISCIVRYPEQRLTAVVLANREIRTHACTIAGNLASIARGEHDRVKLERHELRLDPSLLHQYAGSYRLSADLKVIVKVIDGKLFAGLEGQEGRWELFAESRTDFFFKAFDTDIKFEWERDRVAAIRVRRPLKDDLLGRRIAIR